MRDVLAGLGQWWAAGQPAGLATIVDTVEPSPRGLGAALAVGPGGVAVGSVSGGCVDAAVYDLAVAARDGAPPARHRFGLTADGDPFAVGLTCGGVVDVFAETVDRSRFAEFGVLVDALARGQDVALATVVAGPGGGRHRGDHPGEATGSLGADRIDDAVTDDARGLLAAGHSATLTYGPTGQRRGHGLQVFVAAFARAPRLLIFGATDFAVELARIGGALGYRVTVCDARPVFATAARFPHADEVVVAWPHRYLAEHAGELDARTAICVLTHDPKFDLPLLAGALRLPVGYVGAMGSRRVDAARRADLLATGISPAQLERLSSPIGLDLGARTPAETAVSIAADIIARRWGHDGGR